MQPKWRLSPAAFEADACNPAIALAPWAGHRQFIYDYVRTIRPATVVELGTYHGCAFFACCQAAKDAGLAWTKLHAVDNWLGNDHDGHYGEDVYQTFLAVAQACYGGLDINPVRKQFAEAVADFPDASVDLLHIDGCHTYEAVAADWQDWLPKLADEGAVFLHDVFTERHGSTRFWRELTAAHPSLLFEHCFGLGLVFPKGDRLHRHLTSLGLPGLAPFYARLGRLEMELAEARAALADAAREAAGAGTRAETRAAILEARLSQAEAEAARHKALAEHWRQLALDSQWQLDCGHSPHA